MSFADYVSALERSIPPSEKIASRTTTIRPFSDSQGRIEIVFKFSDDSELHVAQVINLDESDPVGKYGYHYQDTSGRLIFRYDNKTHQSELPTFPHHKHLPDDIVSAMRPSLPDVINEALAIVANIEPKK